jgi:hypothetical protein
MTKYKFWFLLSIFIAILFSCSGLKLAFESPYTIQDDARQHIFWMQQFEDSELFINDLIADYFKSVAPWGFTNLYKLLSNLGIDIFWFNKICPLLIGIVTSIYCFLVCVTIFPVPFAAFVATLLLNQNLWMLDDLSSGTPRSFVYPLLLSFIYYLLKSNLGLCLLVIVLQGLFYPQLVLLSAVILALELVVNLKNPDKVSRSICCSGLFTAAIILGIYALKTSDFNTVISGTEAKLLPEFGNDGRNAFFLDNPLAFWFSGQRSGFFPREWQYTLMCSYGISLIWFYFFPKQFPLVKKLDAKAIIILEALFASSIVFVVAHLCLFKLHLPSRYSQHSLRVLIALIDGIVIAIIVNKFGKAIEQRASKYRNFLKIPLIIILVCALLFPTYAVQSYPFRLGYVNGQAPELYRFLQQQPKNYLIASLSQESDFIPTFAKRSILVSQEYAIPYHIDYYRQIRQRVKDLIAAQYSLDPEIITDFILKYRVDLWLLDKTAFTVDYLQRNSWLNNFQPQNQGAIELLKAGKKPFLLTQIDRCKIFEDVDRILLKTNCINKM